MKTAMQTIYQQLPYKQLSYEYFPSRVVIELYVDRARSVNLLAEDKNLVWNAITSLQHGAL